jgi:hypothetical protein
MFMILAVLLIIVTIVLLGWPSSLYMMSTTGQFRFRLTPAKEVAIAACFIAVAATCTATWWLAMRSGVRALDGMRD